VCTNERKYLTNVFSLRKDTVMEAEKFYGVMASLANIKSFCNINRIVPFSATTRKLEKGLLAVHSPFIQDQHEMVVNSLDTNREVAVNKELHQLSDVLKQVQIHVEDVAEAQRNGIKSQKLSQGLLQHIKF